MDILELYNKIRCIDINKLIFWVGAGIDRNAPTNLPLGNDLLKFILNNTCGQTESNKLYEIWEKNQSALKGICNNFVSIPRLETVLDELLTCETHMESKQSFFNGLSSFENAPPNSIHFLLAHMLMHGANIVTTNFETCVQKAYHTMYPNEPSCNSKMMGSIPVFSNGKQASGKIFYIHGIASRLDEIGASLRQLKEGLCPEFTQILSTWLSGEYYFIFLGYSCSDTLDINPFLQLHKGNKKAVGIYVRHCLNTSKIVEATKKEKQLLDVFAKNHTIEAPTNYFLQEVFDNFSFPMVIDNYDWESDFLSVADMFNEECKNIFLISLCGTLGINILQFLSSSLEELVNENSPFSKWYKIYTCYRMSSIKADYKKVEFYLGKLKLIESKDYFEHLETEKQNLLEKMTYDKKYIKKVFHISSKLSDKIKNNLIVDWEISTPLNLISKMFIYGVMEKTIEYVLREFEKEINETQKCFKRIIDYGYEGVSELHQIYLAQRYLAVLKAINGVNKNEALELLDISTFYYAEISRTAGVIGNLLVYIFILSVYGIRCRNYEDYDKIKKMYKAANRLIEINGYYRYQKTLERYMSFAKKVFDDICIE